MDKIKQEAGRKGAQVTHRRRYEALVELSKYVGKAELDKMRIAWKTDHLISLLKAYSK